jgi:hypothetical protein
MPNSTLVTIVKLKALNIALSTSPPEYLNSYLTAYVFTHLPTFRTKCLSFQLLTYISTNMPTSRAFASAYILLLPLLPSQVSI